MLTTLTNGGASAPLLSPRGQVPLEHRCAVSGGTSRDCTLMGTGMPTIHLVLGADNCVASGLWGGTAAFNGMITIDSIPFFTNSCGPPPSFTSGDFVMEGPPDDPQQGFVTILRDGMMNEKEYIASQLKGTVSNHRRRRHV
jgi:hypothetical protein